MTYSWRKELGFRIDQSKCRQCGACDRDCMLTKYCGYRENDSVDKSFCILCGRCIVACPHGAISHDAMKITRTVRSFPERQQLMTLIKETRSIREYRPDPITKEEWACLAEAVRYSKTGCNYQEIEMLVIESKETLAKISQAVLKMVDLLRWLYSIPFTKLFLKFMHPKNEWFVRYLTIPNSKRHDLLKSGKDPILYGAPALALFVGPKLLASRKEDADIAAENMMLLAATMGIGTCYMGVINIACDFNYRPVTKLFPLKKGYRIYQSMVVGRSAQKHAFFPERKGGKVFFERHE